jgi:hypothetical protein
MWWVKEFKKRRKESWGGHCIIQIIRMKESVEGWSKEMNWETLKEWNFSLFKIWKIMLNRALKELDIKVQV